MPGIHDKTHFKSAVTLGYKLPSSLFTAQDAYNPFNKEQNNHRQKDSEPGSPIKLKSEKSLAGVAG